MYVKLIVLMEAFPVCCSSSSFHALIKIDIYKGKNNVVTVKLVSFLILHHNKVKTNGILKERSYLLFDQPGIAKPINSAFRREPNKDLGVHWQGWKDAMVEEEEEMGGSHTSFWSVNQLLVNHS